MAFSSAVNGAGRTEAGAGTSAAAAGTIGAALEQAVRAAGRRESVVHVGAGTRQTYSSLTDEVQKIARALLASGVGRGDRVAVLAGSRAHFAADPRSRGAAAPVVAPANARDRAD